MTKSWQKRHWALLILVLCVLILVLWPSSGVSEAIRVIGHGLLDLLGRITQEIIILTSKVIDKI